jgi:hypothetical protein
MHSECDFSSLWRPLCGCKDEEICSFLNSKNSKAEKCVRKDSVFSNVHCNCTMRAFYEPNGR